MTMSIDRRFPMGSFNGKVDSGTCVTGNGRTKDRGSAVGQGGNQPRLAIEGRRLSPQAKKPAFQQSTEKGHNSKTEANQQQAEKKTPKKKKTTKTNGTAAPPGEKICFI